MSEAAKPGHWPGTWNNVWQRTGGGDSPGFQPQPGAGSATDMWAWVPTLSIHWFSAGGG